MTPKFQKAWMVVGQGEPAKVLKLRTDVPVLDNLRSGECLVKIMAAALNPAGYKLMKYAPTWLFRRPYVPEQGISGIVVSQRDTEFKDGDEVLGWTFDLVRQEGREGALSQYIRVPSQYITAKPPNVTFQEASGLILAGLTAYRMLVDVAKVESGQTIFINGGGTSCGRYAIEIAKALGCRVVASCSLSSLERVRGYGADEVIDYTTSPVFQQLTISPPSSKFHAILDCYGETSPLLYTRSKPFLSPSGIFVSIGPQPHSLSEFLSVSRLCFEGFLRPVWLGGLSAKFRVFLNGTNKKQYLDTLARFVSEGKIRPVVDSVYAFDDVLKAYEKIMTGKKVGKVVVNIDHDDD